MNSPDGAVSRAGRVWAWGGALLFAASLGYFLWSYALTFGETQQPAAAGPAILWNVALFTVFALHHSVFARERVRALVARTVPSALERSFYVWIASLLFIAVCAFWRPVPGVAWRITPIAAYAVLAVGVWLTLRSAAALDIWELAGVRQAEAGRVRGLPAAARVVPTEFKTTGPYGLVRHPIYLGWFLLVLGVPEMTGTRLAFAAISCTYLVLAIPLEERTLRKTTGGRYDDYMRVVRWRLVPWVY